MADLTAFRKNKIELIEYEYTKDIENRVLMSEFSALEIDVLEEILYSSLRTPLSLLEKNLNLSSAKLAPILEILSKTKLFTVSSDHVLVDKEMRKYYEFQVLKFEDDFRPGMEYLQGLLRKVPIHVLPSWYSIPRTSHNIFDSIVEKYLQVPLTFQRYLMELTFTDPAAAGIMAAVYQSPDYCVDASDMMEKFTLTQEQFEEQMIFLEFSFVCCVSFRRVGDHFKKVITPFQEWHEYLLKVQAAELSAIIDEDKIVKEREDDFFFIKRLSALVDRSKDQPVTSDEADFSVLATRLCNLRLAEYNGRELKCNSDIVHWVNMDLKERGLYLYRNPLSVLRSQNHPEYLLNERVIREAEKSLLRVSPIGWVYLDEFLEGVFIPLHENQAISLKRSGRTWNYDLPKYSEEEIDFLKALIQDWLFEAGIVSLGKLKGRDCFCLTPFGQTVFVS